MDDRLTPLLLRVGRLATHEGYGQQLNPAQWQALHFLAVANRFSRTPGAMAEWLGATKGTVSQTAKVLVERGLARRLPSASDKRVVQLELTESGHAALAANENAMADQLLGALDAQERTELEGLLGKMLRGAIAANGGAPFGICRQCRHFREQGAEGAHLCNLLEVPLSDSDAGHYCIEFSAT